MLLVFSHLRWDSVFQRPQHVLSRLAGRWRVLFVEEPVHTDGLPTLEVHKRAPELEVLVPRTPVAAPGFHDDQLAHLQALLESALHARGLHADVAWLDTPMALPLANCFSPSCLVYDCMAELAAFKDAPHQLRQRESTLLREAAQVFTAGPSLYESRRALHPHVKCFPSAVDAAHFAPGRLQPDSEHCRQAQALQGSLPHPRLGFFGVIDERMDLALLATMADLHPEWALVMVGPVVTIDPRSLPMRANIHWLGRQPYDRLPYLMVGWDLCLMPFALNDATRLTCPTKTLEYMAGEKPIVSTPVPDVILMYGTAVAVAAAALPFVQACEAVLTEGAAARYRRCSEMLSIVSMHSWRRTADCMHILLRTAMLQARHKVPADGSTLPDSALV